MNTIAMCLGYIMMVFVVLIIAWGILEQFKAAYWYYSRFNSGNISNLEKIIRDANLRIDELNKKTKKL